MTPVALVVMGVSGVGKSTVSAGLARTLGWPFVEADEFHSAENIAKLRSGQPLSEADRAPWLASVRDEMNTHAAAGQSMVVACSALRRAYRDVLRQAQAAVWFVHLLSPAEVIAERLTHRPDHFMHPGLLGSQIELLEPLASDEQGVAFPSEYTADHTIARIAHWLGQLPTA